MHHIAAHLVLRSLISHIAMSGIEMPFPFDLASTRNRNNFYLHVSPPSVVKYEAKLCESKHD